MMLRAGVPMLLGLFLAGCRPTGQATPPAPSLGVAPEPEPEPEPEPASEPASKILDLTPVVAKIRRRHGVPGLGAAIVDGEGMRALGVAGLRRADQEGDLEPADKFHLGSDTKAMTAFLIGRLVERGVLDWDVTLAEALPDAPAWMHTDYRGVVLLQLLRHRAGLPANALLFSPEAAGVGAAPLDEQRLELAKRFLSTKPFRTPGAEFSYSNVGYIVAGLIAEQATKLPWETLMQLEVFDPLGMHSCGFGPTSTGDETGQPWAHAFVDGAYRPTDMDNPSYLGPAGTVHCSLEDWGKFAAAQFDSGSSAVVSGETLAKLHAAVPLEDGRGGYALGWLVAKSKMFDGPMLTHDGSNTVNYASILVVPQSKVAIVAACNAGGEHSQKAVVELMQALLQSIAADRAPSS